MPVTSEEIRAVCRITVGDRRGTGFLIDSGTGLVLTAAHVVVGETDNLPAAAAVNVQFATPPGEELPAQSIVTAIVNVNRDLDFAVLKCSQVPNVRAFEPDDLRPGAKSAWTTFGFGGEAPTYGRGYEGSVTALGSELVQIQFDRTDTMPEGLSGGPCIVNGRVVGLLRLADKRPTGVGYMVPFRRLAAGCSLLKLPPEPPYVSYVAQEIEKVRHLLIDAAAQIQLPPMDDTARPRAAATTMMVGGVPVTIRALLALVAGLPVRNAKRILGLSAHTWIDRESVRQMFDALTNRDRKRLVMFLNANCNSIGEWYLHRARCMSQPYPGMPAAVECVLPFEPDASGADVRKAIERARQNDDDDDAIILLIVPPPPPPSSAISKLLAEHPSVRFLLLGGDTFTDVLREEYPDAIFLTPPIPPRQEDEVLEAHARAVKQLERSYRQLEEEP